jgi:hypothetical protein
VILINARISAINHTILPHDSDSLNGTEIVRGHLSFLSDLRCQSFFLCEAFHGVVQLTTIDPNEG